MDSEIFKALSDSNRLRIMAMLKNGETSAHDLLRDLDITQPTLSHHMKVLQSAELVNMRRSGQKSLYSVNEPRLDEVALFILCLKSSRDSL